MDAKTGMNHIQQEASFYLQQHANNPVEWYPWGEEALAKARAENKPILLSIGYSACHWCHVMAHESFEDEVTANLMNQFFINIKVDREERPDIDKIYQAAHQILTKTPGGWPLNVFLTPKNLIPFYSGTYFPKKDFFYLPAFKKVLLSVINFFKQKESYIESNYPLLFEQFNPPKCIDYSYIILNDEPVNLAFSVLEQQYDKINGGFGKSPKFPQSPKLEFLIRQSSSIGYLTLQKMAQGGIYDQIGGGFYRYSVDQKWQIPHFEKMLYENGQLLFLYALAAKKYKEIFFLKIAHETANMVIEKMQSNDGSYYSSFDSDSEGEEGKYYLWDKKELKLYLTQEEYQVVERYYGLSLLPNIGEKWHLFVAESLVDVAKNLSLPQDKISELLSSAKTKLKMLRSKRIAPACNTTMLTSWNCIMIKGMLSAGEYLDERKFIQSAERALSFIKEKCWKGYCLLANDNARKNNAPGYLDDYAYLIDALLTALTISWKTDYLLLADQLSELLLNNFYDEESSCFYFVQKKQEKILFRQEITADDAISAGKSIAIRSLLLLGYLLGKPHFISVAEKALKSAWQLLLKYPEEHCSLLSALKLYLIPPDIIFLRGPPEEMLIWKKQCISDNYIIFCIPENELNLPSILAEKKAVKNTIAYFCRGTSCASTINNLSDFRKRVSQD